MFTAFFVLAQVSRKNKIGHDLYDLFRDPCRNTAVKLPQKFQKDHPIIYGAQMDNERSFFGYKAKIKTVERPYLTKEEIQMIYEKKFASDRLNQVHDIFLFS